MALVIAAAAAAAAMFATGRGIDMGPHTKGIAGMNPGAPGNPNMKGGQGNMLQGGEAEAAPEDPLDGDPGSLTVLPWLLSTDDRPA